MENGYAFAGINAFRATKITTVKEVFAELKSDFQAKLTMINDKIKELKDSNDSSESNDL
jgi:chromosome condensin MukBEF ATPase and DNA-binding subunit MukB